MSSAPAEQAKFLSGSLMRHVTVMSLTASIGLMAVFAVDVVDMIFISMLGKKELAAAVGYAGAILFFTTSFNIGMAIASGALVARALGAGDGELARRRASSALLIGGLLSAGFAALIWSQLDLLVGFLGAAGETRALAVHYLQIVVPSLPFLLMGMAGGAILRAHGDAKRAMFSTISGGVVNAVLDPILIFGLGLDLTGAAIASAVARVAMAWFALAPILRHHGGFGQIRFTGVLRDVAPIFAIALPAILTQLATPVGQAFVTRTMANFGEEAVAGMAIIARLTPLAFASIFALSGAVGPIVGQNFGAQQFDRVRITLRAALLFIGVVVSLMAALLFALRTPIADVFGAEGATRALVFLFCGPLALAFFFNGLVFVANAFCNNMGRPFQSTLLNWGRHTLGTIPLVWLGAYLGGAPGALIGQAIGGVIFGLLGLWLALKVIAQTQTQSLPLAEAESAGHDPNGPQSHVAEPNAFQRQARQIILSFNRR